MGDWERAKVVLAKLDKMERYISTQYATLSSEEAANYLGISKKEFEKLVFKDPHFPAMRWSVRELVNYYLKYCSPNAKD